MDLPTIPNTAIVVTGDFWGGWTWITKSFDLSIYRTLVYKGRSMDTFQLVIFRKEEHYEQFKDDLEWYESERLRSAERLTKLSAGGLHNNRGF